MCCRTNGSKGSSCRENKINKLQRKQLIVKAKILWLRVIMRRDESSKRPGKPCITDPNSRINIKAQSLLLTDNRPCLGKLIAQFPSAHGS